MAEAKKLKMDAKGMLKEHAEKGTKIRYRERIELEIIESTEFYKKGQKISPHKVMGEQLIKDKIAKRVK